MAVETLTFGCRLNTVESEALRVHAAADGRDTAALTWIAPAAARRAWKG